MTKTVSRSLSARMERIERQNRRLRWALGGLVVISAAGGVSLSGFDVVSQGRTVSAERFELRRANGTLAGVFGTTATGAVSLVLIDGQKRVRATIGVNDQNNPAIVLISPGGQQRVTLADSPSGSAMILFDDAAKARWTATVSANGQPALQLYDAQGAVTWKAQ